MQQLSSGRLCKTFKQKNEHGQIELFKMISKQNNPNLLDQATANILNSLSNVILPESITESKTHYLLKRPFIYTNLYDRLSTRPFFDKDEKIWITYQILLAMSQVHEVNLVHGDLKLENILVTSWNWVLVSDFATHKPCILPDDDPYTFSQQFDIAFRHCCNVAPERFIHFENIQQELNSSIVTPQMDIFSLGCVLAEIQLEQPLFSYAQLILYKNNKHFPNLDQIEDPELRTIILQMISLNPSKRPHLHDVLDNIVVFPSCYSQFHSYCNTFNKFDFHHFLNWSVDYPNIFDQLMVGNCLPGLGDVKLVKLAIDVDSIVLNQVNDKQPICHLFLTLALSWIRNASSKHAIILFFTLVNKCLPFCSDLFKLERIMPFFIYFLKHDNAFINTIAILNLPFITKNITVIPPNEANLFISYILPPIVHCSKFGSESSKFAISMIAGELATISKSYINKIDDQLSAFDDQLFTFDACLFDLQQAFQEIIISLITANTYSKVALINHSYLLLAEFLGKTSTDNLLIAHLSTFISDSHLQVKLALQQSILPLEPYINETLVTTILMNGINDANIIIVNECLKSATFMLPALKRPFLLQFMTNAAIYLVHPSIHITCKLFMQQALSTISPADALAILNTTLSMFTHVTLFEPTYFSDMVIPQIDFNPLYHACRQSRVANTLINHFKSQDTTFSMLDLSILPTLTNPLHSWMLLLNPHFINVVQDHLEYEFIYTQLMHYTILLNDQFRDKLNDLQEDWVFNKMRKSSHSLMVDLTLFLPMDEYEYYGLNKHLKKYVCLKFNQDGQTPIGISNQQNGVIRSEIKGINIGKLVEHNGSVNCIQMSQDCTWFASSSTDGTIKIWDCKRLERNVANSSKTTIVVGGHVDCLGRGFGNTIISGSDLGIHVHDIGHYKPRLVNKIKLEEDNCVSLSCDGHLMGYCTMKNLINLLDTRQQAQLNSFEIPANNGLTTAINLNNNLLHIGTSRGNILTFDVRFLKSLSEFSIPSQQRITNLTTYNNMLASTSTSGELSIWDVLTLECKMYANDKMVESKGKQVLGRDDFIGNKQEPAEFNGLLNMCCTSDGIIAGGADGTVKMFLENQMANDKNEYSDVFQAKYKKIAPHYVQYIGNGVRLHDDAINAIGFTNVPYNIMITGSQDGSIMLWK